MSAKPGVFSFFSPRVKLLAAKNKTIGPIAKALRVHKIIKWLAITVSSIVLVQMLFLGVDFKRCNQCRRTIDTSLVVIGGLLIIPCIGFIGLNAYTLVHYTKTTVTEIDLSETPEVQFRSALLETHNDMDEFYLEPDGIP